MAPAGQCMTTHRLDTVLGPLLRAAHARDAEAQTDGQLLTRFVRHGDEAAFAVLVRRHGSMVLGVCRRVLGNAADADDAFQATFLVLVRRASSLAARPVLGDYLHGTARRTALNARRLAARRRLKERAAARPAIPPPEPRNDWLPLLDEEVGRLPEKYRLPLVLCDLEGRTRHEAARQLGWAEGTVAGRLARARDLLARRLVRSAPLLAGARSLLLGEAGAQAVPPVLVSTTVQSAAAVLAGNAAVSAEVLTLAKGVLQSMLWNKVKFGVIVFLAALATAGVGGLTYRVAAGGGQPTAGGRANAEPGEQPPVRAAADAPPPPKKRPPVVRELDVRGIPADNTDAKEHRQTVFDNADQLAEAMPDKEWQAKIAKQVDFDNERLLFFSWSGSSGDKLTYTVEEGKVGPTVVFHYSFHYSFGKTKDLVRHAHLFALPRDVGFKVADDDAKQPAAVREIDLNGFKAEPPKSLVAKPTTITDRDELANSFPDREWRQRIAKQVDFGAERLLYFRWSGASGDRLWSAVEEDKTGRLVVFHYFQGDEDDEHSHFRLFAVAKDVRDKVEETKVPPAPATPPAREIDLPGMAGKWQNPFGDPAVFTSDKQLTNALPDKKWHAPILKQVDFRTEQLLFFGWSGAKGDQLWFTVEEGDKGRIVVYHHYQGKDEVEAHHARLFVQSKDVGWRVEESKQPGPAPLAYEIEIIRHPTARPTGTIDKPTIMTTPEETAKVLKDKLWEAHFVKPVDFTKERLLLFAWTDSPGVNLRFTTVDGKDGPVVVFHHTPGNGDDSLVSYFRLFAVAKKATWRIEIDLLSPRGDEPTPPVTIESNEQLLKDLESADAFARAAAIDKLAVRKAKEAIPKLIELLTDGTALIGSDNYVGLHAAAALKAITGQSFDTDQKKWKEWWKEQQANVVAPAASGDPVKVLRSEVTVELRGFLAHTPKGVFLLVPDGSVVGKGEQAPWEGEGSRLRLTTAWELDVSKVAGLDKQAKELSGKAVVVTGTCQIVRVQTKVDTTIPDPSTPPAEAHWELQKVVTVSKLATDK